MSLVTGFFFLMISGIQTKQHLTFGRGNSLNVQPTKGNVFVKLDSLVKLKKL